MNLLFSQLYTLLLLTISLKNSKSEVIDKNLKNEVEYLLESTDILKKNIDDIIRLLDKNPESSSVISDFVRNSQEIIRTKVFDFSNRRVDG